MPRKFMQLVLAFVATAAACGKPEAAAEANDAPPAAVMPPFQQEIASLGAEVTLPGVWRHGYRMVDKADTTYGSHRAIEFHYAAESGNEVQPRLLLVIRAFHKPVYDKIREAQKGVSQPFAEHGGDIYTFSIVTSNPYSMDTAAGIRVEQMMLALISDESPFRLTFR